MQIREQVLREQQGMIGKKIVSLSQFLSSYIYEEIPSLPRTLLTVHKRLYQLQTPFVTYQNVIHTPSFLKECYECIQDLRFWNISMDQLPKQNEAQKELYEIVRLFEDINVPSDLQKKALSSIQHLDLTHVYIVDTYQSLEEKKVQDILYKQGAQRIEQQSLCTHKEFYHALNKRVEVEACAQYIIQHNLQAEDIHISLCDASYQTIIKQIFQRYEIPFTLLQDQHSSITTKRFLALLDFYIQPNSTTVLACLDCGVCTQKGLHYIREYMRVFSHDFFEPFQHVSKIEDFGNVMDGHTFSSLQKLEENAREVYEEVLPFFTTLRDMTSLEDVWSCIAHYVKESIRKPEEISIYKNVLSLLEDVHDLIVEKEDIQFLRMFIQGMSIYEQPSTMQGLLVHALTQSTLDRPHHFLLGATQTKYPAFSVKNGIFDEAYYACISQYPSMQERYHHYLYELEKLLERSTHIYISYPLSTYEGKGMEAALEIEQFVGKASTSYPIHENYRQVDIQHHIDSETAYKLFVHDQVIKGSISSIERYVKCPFSYFLRYGLSLKEPMKLGFPDSYAGTLSHYVLETLIALYGKAYTTHVEDTMSSLLDDELDKLQTVFPAMKDALENVKNRLYTSMIQTMYMLEDFEQHSSLAPSKCEYAFRYEIPIQQDVILAMSGYIDRIDESREFACILDYKSSMKVLSETNVFAALQLQLLTYAMVMQKESGKEMLGAYYVSLKNENIPYPAGSIHRRKPVTHYMFDQDTMEEERKKAHRFNGWTFHKDIYTLDDEASHIKGIRKNKDGEIKSTKLYDLTAIKTHFDTMYQMITKRILSGDIQCIPLEDACTYCVYHEICRFHGFYEEKKVLIEVDDEIYQKGDSEDA